MNKKFYASCLLMLVVLGVQAQAPVVKWQNAAISDTPFVQKFVEDGYEWTETSGVYENLVQLLPLPDGNFMGVVTTYRAKSEHKLVKFNANGDTIFVKKLGDFEVIAHVNRSIVATADGGFVLVGYDRTLTYPYPVSVLKVDASGNQQWKESYRGGTAEVVTANSSPGSIINTLDGGFLLANTSNHQAGNDKTENSKGGDDYWLIKLGASGLVEWDKTIGGNGRDEAAIVVQAADGSYFVAGNSQSSASGDKSEDQKGGTIPEGSDINYNADFWIVKLTSDGTVLWDKTIGGSDKEYLRSFVLTADGGFLLGGQSESGIGYDKTSPNYGDGSYTDDMWVLKCNGQGTIQWQQGLGGSGTDNLIEVEELADGSCIVGGNSGSGISGTKTVQGYDTEGSGNTDFWIVKINPAGAVVWQTAVGGSGGEGLGALQPLTDGGILLAGSSTSTISGVRTVAQKGKADLWFVRLGDVELPVNLLSFTGYKVNDDAKLAWTTATEENFSHFELQKQDAPGHFFTLANVPAKGNNSHYNYADKLNAGINYYRLKMVDKDGTTAYSSIVTITAADDYSNLRVWPNPVISGSLLNIGLPEAQSNAYWQIIGVDGKVFASQKIAANAMQIKVDVKGLAKGNYLLMIVSDRGRTSTKFVKQ